MEDNVKEVILEVHEEMLKAQLHAIKQMRRPKTDQPQKDKGRSQMQMAYDILLKARQPMHVTDIIARIEKVFAVTVDRESLVSALTKKVARGDRFIRTDKNTFALREKNQ